MSLPIPSLELDDAYISDNDVDATNDIVDINNGDKDIDDEDENISDNESGISDTESETDELPNMNNGSFDMVDNDSDDDMTDYTITDYETHTDNISQTLLSDYHHESAVHNNVEIAALCKIIRNDQGIIIDEFHKTFPVLSKFEKARIIGMRIKQLNSGADPFINLPPNTSDSEIIALAEINAKKLPFIVRRPMPNGGSEYWKLSDLEMV